MILVWVSAAPLHCQLYDCFDRWFCGRLWFWPGNADPLPEQGLCVDFGRLWFLVDVRDLSGRDTVDMDKYPCYECCWEELWIAVLDMFVPTKTRDQLLWVICRVGKYSKIKAPFNAITTFDHNTVLISLQKVIVKQFFPLRVEELPLAMSHKCFARTFAAAVQCCKVIKFWRHLLEPRGIKMISHFDLIG